MPIYLNGSTLSTITVGTATTNSGVVNSFSIDRAGAYNGYYFTGDIAKIIIYNRALTSNERKRVDAYLKNKYGLQEKNIDQKRTKSSKIEIKD